MGESKQIKRTRLSISNAFFKLLERKTFDDITVIDICEEALITRATFYKYYEDKYHLINCMLEDLKSEIFEKELANYENLSPKELYIKIAELCINFMEQNRDKLSVLIKNENNNKLRSVFLKSIEESIENILTQQDINLKANLPIDILSKFFTGGITYVGLYIVENKNKFSKDKIMTIVKNFIDSVFASIL